MYDYRPLDVALQIIAQCNAAVRDHEDATAEKVANVLRHDFHLNQEAPVVESATLDRIVKALTQAFHEAVANQRYDIAHKFNHALTCATLVRA